MAVIRIFPMLLLLTHGLFGFSSVLGSVYGKSSGSREHKRQVGLQRLHNSPTSFRLTS